MRKIWFVALFFLTLCPTFSKTNNPSYRGERARINNCHRDPNISHGVVLPTGVSLRRGEFYFADHEIIWLQFAYGLIDRVQLSFGTIFPVSADFNVVNPGLKVMVTPREFPLSVSIGGSYSQPLSGEAELGGGLLGYISGTYGTTSESITLCIGYTGTTYEEVEGEAFVGFTGQFQVSSSIKLIGEVVGLPDVEDGFGGFFGVRFIGSRTTFDLMGFRPFAVSGTTLLTLPYISFHYYFGNPKGGWK